MYSGRPAYFLLSFFAAVAALFFFSHNFVEFFKNTIHNFSSTFCCKDLQVIQIVNFLISISAEKFKLSFKMVLVNPIYSLEDNSSYNQLCLENSNLSCLASLTPSPTESKAQPQFGPSEEEKQALIDNLNKEIGKWMDLSVFCQSLRNIVEVDGDVSFFHGKRILEIGFTTGLPAIYALEKFAESVMVVCAVRILLS